MKIIIVSILTYMVVTGCQRASHLDANYPGHLDTRDGVAMGSRN